MKFSESFFLAIKNITSSKVRTFLTMIGIIIGVVAVIIIVGLGNGLQGYIADSFSDMGTNTLTIMINGRGQSTRNISVDQMYDIVDQNPEYLDLMSPTVSINSTVKIKNDTADSTTVTGVSEDYFTIKNYTVSSGRGISYGDISQRKRICVIGEYLNKNYYDGNAVGNTIKVGGNTFTIVGILSAETEDMEEGGTDDAIYLPYSTASRISNTGRINSFTITLKDENLIDQSQTVIETALYEIFEDSNSYSIINMSEMLESMTSMINMLVLILSGIAAISLVVGGIGIMNIMLVSVTERTREIGIRKSLGAKERYIMQQFVIEAATTSTLGGVIGILIGYGLSAIASSIISSIMDASLNVAPTTSAVLVSFGISAGIGVLFGYLPAKKAAKLNPIDALRYD